MTEGAAKQSSEHATVAPHIEHSIPIFRLPNEILHRICWFLERDWLHDRLKDLSSVSRTSSILYKIASPLFYFSILINHNNVGLLSRTLIDRPNYAISVRTMTVSLSLDRDIEDDPLLIDGALALIPRLANLKELRISTDMYAWFEDGKQLPTVPSLTSLIICPFSFMHLDMEGATSLRTFAPNLTSLSIAEASTEMDALACIGQELKELRFHNTTVDAHTEPLLPLTKLTRLEVDGYTLDASAIHQLLTQCTSLRYIYCDVDERLLEPNRVPRSSGSYFRTPSDITRLLSVCRDTLQTVIIDRANFYETVNMDVEHDYFGQFSKLEHLEVSAEFITMSVGFLQSLPPSIHSLCIIRWGYVSFPNLLTFIEARHLSGSHPHLQRLRLEYYDPNNLEIEAEVATEIGPGLAEACRRDGLDLIVSNGIGVHKDDWQW